MLRCRWNHSPTYDSKTVANGSGIAHTTKLRLVGDSWGFHLKRPRARKIGSPRLDAISHALLVIQRQTMWLEHAGTSLWKQPFDSVLNVLLNRLHVYSAYDVYVSTFTHVLYIYINIFKSPYTSRDQDGRPQTILELIFINIYVYKTIFLSWFLVLKDWCRFHLPFCRSFEVQNKKSHKRSQAMPNAILYMKSFQKNHQAQSCTETLGSSTPLDITQMGLDEPLCTYRKVVPENPCANGRPTQNKSQENWLQNQIWSTHSCTRHGRHGFPGGVGKLMPFTWNIMNIPIKLYKMRSYDRL